MTTSRLKESALAYEIQRINVTANFFEFLSTEFAACSKRPCRDNNRRKASYLTTQQRDQGAG